MLIFNFANFIIVKPQMSVRQTEINTLPQQAGQEEIKNKTDDSRNESGRFIGIDS